MDGDEFRRCGKQMIDYVTDYLEDNIKDRPVFPPRSEIQPGFMAAKLPKQAPQEPEAFEAIMKDVDAVVMPGVTHWHSPRFFSYFETANSYPATIADILSDGFGSIGFTWASSPSCTELETVMMDWLAKMLKLPDHFLFESKGHGGGVIHGTASEATLTALLSARSRAIDHCTKSLGLTMGGVLDRLVAFSSEQAHSSVERAGLLGAVPHIVQVPTDENNALRGPALRKAIDEAVSAGLIPFFVTATLGTTSTCAFDNLVEMAQVVKGFNGGDKETPIWLHVDAAYAGSAFSCPEFRPLLDGVEHVDSFNFNPHKFMLMNFDCSATWFRDARLVVDAFNVDPIYLKHDHQSGSQPDYRHWQIPLGRRFRSLKIFFVLRSYGVKKIQAHIRNQVAKAKHFEELVQTDDRFEVMAKVVLGLVCFRLKPPQADSAKCNAVNKALLRAIGVDNRIHLVPAEVKGIFMLRFAIVSSRSTKADIEYGWKVIQELANQVLAVANA